MKSLFEKFPSFWCTRILTQVSVFLLFEVYHVLFSLLIFIGLISFNFYYAGNGHEFDAGFL